MPLFKVSLFLLIIKMIDQSIIVVDYYISVIAYIGLGFDVLVVNYRGSTGFGQGK